MSNSRARRRRLRTTPSLDPAALKRAIVISSAIRGCTCSPSVRHVADRVDVGHDLDCPAADTGPALVIGPPRTPTNGGNHP